MKQEATYKNIIRVTIPVIISGLSVNIVNITDTIFISQLGETQLGAAGNAGILYYIFVLLGMGFSIGSQIVIGRRNGEKNYHLIGSLVTQTFYFLMFLALLFFLFVNFILPILMQVMVKSPQVMYYILEYMQTRKWGLFFTLGNLVFIAFYVGTARTKILGIITPFMALLNILLDYALIFGNLGFPALGVSGAALASNIAEGFGLLCFLLVTINLKAKTQFNLFLPEKIKILKIKKLLFTGGPIMVQNFLTLTSWFVFFAIIENLGERELAISHIARSIYMFSMIPVFGLGDATNTLVSNLMGQNEAHKIKLLIVKILKLGVLCNLIIAPVMFIFMEPILNVYTQNLNLIEAAKPTMFVVYTAIIFFTVAIILFRAITGIGKTQTALFIETITIIIYVAYIIYLGVYLKTSVALVWTSEYIYFIMLIILSALYLKFANWQNTKL